MAITIEEVLERAFEQAFLKALEQTVQVKAEEGNQLTAAIRLNGPSFLPAIPVTFAIEDQPALPQLNARQVSLLRAKLVLRAEDLLARAKGIVCAAGIGKERLGLVHLDRHAAQGRGALEVGDLTGGVAPVERR